MDLADLWAQHKKFILAVAGALLLLLIGRGVIRSQFPYESVEGDARRLIVAMQRAEEVPESVVREVETELSDLRARYAELAGAMRFEVDPDFQVPPGETNPRAWFFRKYRDLQKALVDAAEKRDIRVPEALGLKNTSPTDPEEIRRTLLALNVIQQVLIEAIGGGVRRIEAIRIEDEQLGRGAAAGFTRELRVAFDVVGGERAIRALVAGVVDAPARGEAPFLAVDEARLRPMKGEVGMLELDLTVVALQIEKGDDEELP